MYVVCYCNLPVTLLTMARLVCSVLVNSNTFTANYSVKQSQFTKSTSELRASDHEESNETFDRTIRV